MDDETPSGNGNGSEHEPRFSDGNLVRVIWLLNIVNDRLARIAREHGLLESPLGAALKTMLHESVNHVDGVSDGVGRYFLPAESLGHFDRDDFSPDSLRDAILRSQRSRDAQYSVPFDISVMRYLVKLVAAWSTEPGFVSAEGDPLDIALLGDALSLQALNRKLGSRYPVQQLADELQRFGNCVIVDCDDGKYPRLRLIETAVSQPTSSDEGLAVLAQMCIDFLHSVQEKLGEPSPDIPQFRSAYFIDIRPELAEEVSRGVMMLQKEFNSRYAQFLSNFRSVDASSGIRIGVGSFTFCGSPTVFEESG